MTLRMKMAMKRKLRFYKENEKWYADVPGVSKEDNEMIFGSAAAFKIAPTASVPSAGTLFENLNIVTTPLSHHFVIVE